jgi:hypothetical protein
MASHRRWRTVSRCRARLQAGKRRRQKGPAGRGRASATASSALAHIDGTVCLWKECQVWTSCWSKPTCPFPCYTHSSTGYLFSATLTRMARVTGRPAETWQ